MTRFERIVVGNNLNIALNLLAAARLRREARYFSSSAQTQPDSVGS